MSGMWIEGIDSPAQATYWVVRGECCSRSFRSWASRASPISWQNAWRRCCEARRIPVLTSFDRLARKLKFWLAQWKQPRYLLAGVLHIIIFAGFLVLSVRSVSLVVLGVSRAFRDAGVFREPSDISIT